METILEVKDLVRHFGKLTAVNNVSFKIPRGVCFGLLGPNGAGKTTTVEIMEGIQAPSAGQVLYKNHPLDQQFRQEAGIQFQSTALQEFLTVQDTLNLFGNLYQKTIPQQELIELCSLGDFLDRYTHKLSGGQRQRVLLAIALINDPEIIFLDEPTTGLDPQARRNFWQLIELVKSRDKTIVLTTHYMEEAETLCDIIAIMDKGKVISQGTPRDLLQAHFADTVIQLPKDIDEQILHEMQLSFYVRNSHYDIQSENIEHTIQTLLTHKIPLQQMQIRAWNLEDLFLSLTGSELRV
ncbi:MAG: ABC transporter ATP-binding protein [Gammaproteobacteria bacterium]|nr:ABC transporter ATP-binding protein [Gammaproteobacteria bacterium]MDH5728739.1 ABC transporter ATP-binding protein [Gammaproteobacteria bacterium]